MTAGMNENSRFWRHPSFSDLGLLKARFTRHRYDLHTHPTYVIALITAGCEKIRIGNRNVVAPAGTVALVNPEEWHDGESGAEEGWAYRTFYPSVALLQSVARELGKDQAPVFPGHVIDDVVLARAMSAAHEASTSADLTRAETSMLMALRYLMLRYGDWGKQPEAFERSGARRRVSLYEQMIEDNLDRQLDLQQLASVAGVTRFQVIRDFKKVTGLTPAAFIRDRKRRRAGLLIESGSSLAAAAFEAGFSDQSHLSRTFRGAHGITPGMFQKGWLGTHV
jgi:AraC-like DNA-binding protein